MMKGEKDGKYFKESKSDKILGRRTVIINNLMVMKSRRL